MCFSSGLIEHQNHLKKCCRVCGKLLNTVAKSRKNGYDCNGRDSKSSAPYAELLQHVFSIYTEYDDPDVHPGRFCHRCFIIIGKYCKAQAQQKQYNAAPRLYNWKPHDNENCDFCKRFLGGSRTQKGKRQAKKCEKGAPGQRSEEDQSTSTSNQHLLSQRGQGNDHSYAASSATHIFAMARKRKREVEDDSEGLNVQPSNKKLIMSTEIGDDDFDCNVASLYSADLCLAKPLHVNFQCGICTGILDKPFQTSCCHVFCEKCIKKWVQRFSCCADTECHEIISLRDLRPSDSVFRQIVLDLPMKCVNTECMSHLTVETFEEHILSCEVNNSECESADESFSSSSSEKSFSDSACSSADESINDSICSNTSTTSSKRGRAGESIVRSTAASSKCQTQDT